LTVTNVTDGADELLVIDGENISLSNGNFGTTAANSFGYNVFVAGSTATLTLTKSDTPANYQTLINAFAYSNSSDDPTIANRVVTLQDLSQCGRA